MSNHIADANKMVSDTPRTDAAEKHAYQFKDDATPVCESKFARQLERELNAANESFRKLNIHALNLAARIKRLEEAVQRVEDAAHSIQDWGATVLGDALDELNKAKEDKP